MGDNERVGGSEYRIPPRSICAPKREEVTAQPSNGGRRRAVVGGRRTVDGGGGSGRVDNASEQVS